MNKPTASIERFFKTGVMAIIRIDSPEGVLPTVEALSRGGVEFIEISLVTPRAVEYIAKVHDEFGDAVMIGAGTVLDEASARLAILAGADFLVSPILRTEVIRMARRYGKLSFPGAYTASECLLAWESGADAVKVFPAVPPGPDHIKALHAPLPQIPLVAVGGVTLENLPKFFKAGARGVAGATSLADPELVAAGAYADITRIAGQWIEAARESRTP